MIATAETEPDVPYRGGGRGAFFDFDGLRIYVETSAAAPLAWLEYFLRPWFESPSPHESRVDIDMNARVELLVDAAEFDAATRRDSPSAEERVGCFLLDARVVRLPVVLRDDRWTWIHDDELGVAYGVGTGVEAVVRVVAPADGPGTRTALMRVVRELAMIDSAARGSVTLHAAVAGYERGAIAICGPKRSGKTSLLLQLLLGGGGAFVANDRAIAARRNDGIEVHGLPTILALRGDTVEAFHVLRSRLRALGDRHWQTPAESADTTGRPWAASGVPIDLAPRRFAGALDLAILPHGPLRVAVFPRIDQAAAGRASRRLAPEEARLRLQTSIVGAGQPSRDAEALWPGRRNQHGQHPGLDDIMGEIALMPCFELTLGRAAYEQASLPAEIVELVA